MRKYRKLVNTKRSNLSHNLNPLRQIALMLAISQFAESAFKLCVISIHEEREKLKSFCSRHKTPSKNSMNHLWFHNFLSTPKWFLDSFKACVVKKRYFQIALFKNPNYDLLHWPFHKYPMSLRWKKDVFRQYARSEIKVSKNKTRRVFIITREKNSNLLSCVIVFDFLDILRKNKNESIYAIWMYLEIVFHAVRLAAVFVSSNRNAVDFKEIFQ